MKMIWYGITKSNPIIFNKYNDEIGNPNAINNYIYI